MNDGVGRIELKKAKTAGSAVLRSGLAPMIMSIINGIYIPASHLLRLQDSTPAFFNIG
jgi:hypothetical protein